MTESGPNRRDILIATGSVLTFAGCTESAATASGYGATYGDAYGTE